MPYPVIVVSRARPTPKSWTRLPVLSDSDTLPPGLEGLLKSGQVAYIHSLVLAPEGGVAMTYAGSDGAHHGCTWRLGSALSPLRWKRERR